MKEKTTGRKFGQDSLTILQLKGVIFSRHLKNVTHTLIIINKHQKKKEQKGRPLILMNYNA